MADASNESGFTNVAMDVGETVDDIGVHQPDKQTIGNTTELSLRADKLSAMATGSCSGAWPMSDAVVDVGNETTTSAVVGGGNEFSRDRPFSASMRSRATVASNRSRASMSSSITTSDFTSGNLFSYKVCL